MLIEHIKVSGLLSFGPKGIDLPMRKLNVLIGASGSGKSNLLEVINQFKESPSPMRSISGPIIDAAGVGEWLWKGEWAPDDERLARVEVVLCMLEEAGLRHSMLFGAENYSVRIAEKRIGTVNRLQGQKNLPSATFFRLQECSVHQA